MAPYPTRLRSPSTNEGYTCPAKVFNAGVFGPATRIRQIEGPIWRIRNARRYAAASDSAQVSKHQGGVNLSGESIYCGCLWPGYSHSPNRGPYLANTQCEAVCRCIPLSSGLQAPRGGKHVWRKYLLRVSLARLLAFANSRAQFGEYAMRGCPPPYRTQLGSPHTKYMPI